MKTFSLNKKYKIIKKLNNGEIKNKTRFAEDMEIKITTLNSVCASSDEIISIVCVQCCCFYVFYSDFHMICTSLPKSSFCLSRHFSLSPRGDDLSEFYCTKIIKSSKLNKKENIYLHRVYNNNKQLSKLQAIKLALTPYKIHSN